MLIQHSADILFHRMASIEAGSLSAKAALIARERGAMIAEKTIEPLDAPAEGDAGATHRIDKSA